MRELSNLDGTRKSLFSNITKPLNDFVMENRKKIEAMQEKVNKVGNEIAETLKIMHKGEGERLKTQVKLNEVFDKRTLGNHNKIEALETNLREIIQILVDEDYSSIIPQLKKLSKQLEAKK